MGAHAFSAQNETQLAKGGATREYKTFATQFAKGAKEKKVNECAI